MPTVAEITRRLEGLYGRPALAASGRPLDQLIQTILSQHTSDLNSSRAFTDLVRRFPDWSAARDAPVTDVADAIRSGGLADLKARRIQAVLRQLGDDDLEDLAEQPPDDALARLTALPGVGPKTAACVLLFACGRPVLPVDTHVHRVALRLGLIPQGTRTAAAQARLEAQLAPDDVYSFHVNMIRHGRAVCRARNPRCAACGLRDHCDDDRRRAGSDDG